MDLLRDLGSWKAATDAEREAAARRCGELLKIERPIRRPAPCPRCRGKGCDFCARSGFLTVDVGIPTALFARGFILLPGRAGSAPLLVARKAVDVDGCRRPTPAEWARIVEPTDPALGHLLGLEAPDDPKRSVADVALPPDPVPPGDLSALASADAWILRGREEVVEAIRRFAEGVAADYEFVEVPPGPLTFLPCPCGGSGRSIVWEHGGAFLHYEGEDRPSLATCSPCDGSGAYWEERQAPVGVFRHRGSGRLFRLRPGAPPTLVPDVV